VEYVHHDIVLRTIGVKYLLTYLDLSAYVPNTLAFFKDALLELIAPPPPS